MDEFGKIVYAEVEKIVLFSSARPINSKCSIGNIRMGTAHGRVDGIFYTLIHNFGETSIHSRKYVQILEDNGKISYTIWGDGKSDRDIPSKLIEILKKFEYSE